MDSLKVALIKLALTVCSRLPLSWARAAGRGLSLLYWPLGGRSRVVTLRNIELAYSELPLAERKTLARRSIASTAELISETGHVWLRPWSQSRKYIVQVHGAEQITNALAAKRGVIVLAPHLGNWEVLGLHLGELGNTVSLYSPPALAGLGPLIETGRQRSGATLVPTDSRGLARLLRSVKQGGISGILPDQVPRDLASGQNAPFMGISCFTPTLANNMIRRTGALAVFGFAQRIDDGFIVRYLPAEDAIYSDDDATSLAALNRGVEACLGYCPEQYQWEYKRFKQRPAGADDVYSDLKKHSRRRKSTRSEGKAAS